MNDKILSPLQNFVFAYVFGTQENIENTKGFLKALLDIPEDDYDQLTVVNPNLNRNFKDGKEGIVDLRLTTKSGRIVHVELQVEKKTNLKNRMMYYGSRLIGDQLVSGDDYKEINPVVSILICDHMLLEEEESYINEYEMRNKRNNHFTDLLKLVILELPKLPETEDSAVWPWLKFFKCTRKEEYKMLAKKHPELKKAVTSARKVSLSERRQWGKLLMDMERMDRSVAKKERLREMAAERAEGHQEEKLEIARKMKAAGRSADEIAEFTGLSPETIAGL
jgi:predicted transposase/invertase (TIGR01784 family)